MPTKAAYDGNDLLRDRCRNRECEYAEQDVRDAGHDYQRQKGWKSEA